MESTTTKSARRILFGDERPSTNHGSPGVSRAPIDSMPNWIKKPLSVVREEKRRGKRPVGGDGSDREEQRRKPVTQSDVATVRMIPAGATKDGFVQAGWFRESIEEALTVNHANFWKSIRKMRSTATEKPQAVTVMTTVDPSIRELVLLPAAEQGLEGHKGKDTCPNGPRQIEGAKTGKKARNVLGVRKKIGHSPFRHVRVQQHASIAVKVSLRDQTTLCDLSPPSSSRTAPLSGENSKEIQDPVVGEKPLAID
ncbi:unnamed protein product [Arabis nemorensis]|uniref:Uncharacterized protein n=1 Tax=Arabis nemorensis TaxID=586526 RepID=A0A565AXT7_9BRAS|nr:unnamed protein product [Arabis nemorensis]